MVCSVCGQPLEVHPGAALFPCRRCGLAFEAVDDRLVRVQPQTAAITTELAVPAEVRFLAVWRFLASVEVSAKQCTSASPPGAAWDQVRRAAAPEPPFLYVPAFSVSRVTVHQIGLGLVQAQPLLELTAGIPPEWPAKPRLVGPEKGETWAIDPGFGAVSPVLLGRTDAETVAHFVYLALESRVTPELRSIDYDLSLTGAELVLLPAVYDTRHVRDSNWRLLLREFDGLVA